jgi:hypothetical protein
MSAARELGQVFGAGAAEAAAKIENQRIDLRVLQMAERGFERLAKGRIRSAPEMEIADAFAFDRNLAFRRARCAHECALHALERWRETNRAPLASVR